MINFLKYRWLSAIFSISLVASFIGLFTYRLMTTGSPFNYSVEFTGGTQFLIELQSPVSAEQVKSALESEGWSGVIVRSFADNQNRLLVRVKEFSNDSQGLAENMRQVMQKKFGEQNKVTILQVEAVGAGVGAELRNKSIKAIVISLIAMLIYIAVRFWSFAFATGAVVALVHDAIAMLFVFMFFGIEISMTVIMAILAILGYSINDTIVIFSQIRDNLKRMSGKSLTEIVNTSLNQTLRRTILTSVSTAVVILPLLFLGGEALRNSCIALLVGIIFGTYSSIYIASPVMMLLYKNQN